jgi:hypothetical protein
MPHRPDHQLQQFSVTVIASDSVHVHDMTGLALVHEKPLTVRLCGYGDRLHTSTTTGRAIAWRVVKMHAPKTPRAVIAMTRAGRIE